MVFFMFVVNSAHDHVDVDGKVMILKCGTSIIKLNINVSLVGLVLLTAISMGRKWRGHRRRQGNFTFLLQVNTVIFLVKFFLHLYGLGLVLYPRFPWSQHCKKHEWSELANYMDSSFICILTTGWLCCYPITKIKVLHINIFTVVISLRKFKVTVCTVE